jgi:MtrB/PioB family decaheme-associated outer membrane protein
MRNNKYLAMRPLTLAMQAALLVMVGVPHLASAQDDDMKALTHPTNTVEIGVSNTSTDSANFGEYTGLNKSGADVIGNINMRGGDAYNSEGGTYRYMLNGSDLGTTSRALNATASDQGKWSFGIGYDELRHNFTDTYQTPYLGDMGGNSFTLPAGFGTYSNVNTVAPALFRTVDISTTRKNTSLTAGYDIDSRWSVKFDFNHLDQSGAKLMVFGADAHGGAGGEAGSILPNPTNYKTDTLDLSVNWIGEQSFLKFGYFGSFFRDDYDRVMWTTYKGANVTDTMSTPPGNDFHQLNLSGGYKLTPTTNLSGGLSYGRNTQNEAFVTPDIMTAASPLTSLDGLVITSHADLKLTNQTNKNLALSAGIKYDERNNQTASNVYHFNAIDGSLHGESYSNTPLSNRKTQLELAGDYRLTSDQHLRLTYNREDVKRWCDQYAGNNGVGVNGNCVIATSSADDKLGLAYKYRANSNVNLNVSYSYSDRNTDSDPNAVAPFIGKNGNTNPTLSTAILGLNAGDFPGFYPYFDASRKEQMIKAGVNWQANDKVSVGLSGKYTDDKYDSTYGVTNGNGWSLNLDTSYNYKEDGVIVLYVTQQHRQRDLTDEQSYAVVAASASRVAGPAGANWTNTLKDDDTAIGINFKQAGLMGGRLEITGDLSYSLGTTGYGTVLNYTGATTGSLSCSNPLVGTCGQAPDIKSEMTQLKLTGIYKLDKASKVAIGYMFQKLHATDYYYNGLQYGYAPTALMPTNQQAPDYSVNLISVSYIHNF